MSETINNSAGATYNFDGGQSMSATSNVLPINYESSNGLIITKTPSTSTFSVGDIITYTITITNSSSQYLNGVRIIDNLGGGYLAYVLSSATLSTSSQTYPVTPISTNPLTFTLQQLAVGSTMTLTYKCQVVFNLPSTVSMITNTVKGIGYPYSGTVTGYANSTIQKKTVTEFSITKSSNVTDITPNQSFNYYITLSNNTSSTANVTSITDSLPSNYTLTGVSLKIGGGPTTVLQNSEYAISSGNVLTVPSSTGPTITVPANNTTVLTLTGYFN